MIRWRVVCGLSETMLTLRPQIVLISDDLPTLGRPMNVMKPERCSPAGLAFQTFRRQLQTLPDSQTLEVRSAQNGCRSSRLRILPDPVLGSSSSHEIERGTL